MQRTQKKVASDQTDEVYEAPKRWLVLKRQMTVMVLYSVRNNLFHGGKGFEDDNDHEVIQNALPLLKQLVAAYIGEPP